MTNQKIQLTEKEILNSLSHNRGSESFIKDDFRSALITEGFKQFLELCKCEWLYSDMAIYCKMKLLNKEDFIICRIKVDEEKKAIVRLYSDYNSEIDENDLIDVGVRLENIKFNKEHLLYTQKYNYTDFPLKEYEFYICKNELNYFTFLLKSEY